MRMRKGKSRAGDFHLNIVPIIDCLTILITFMLASGVYLSIGLLQVGVAAPGESANTEFKTDPVSIEVKMNLDRSLEINLKATTPEESKIPSSGDHWDLKQLGVQLSQIQSRNLKIDNLTLIANKEIAYEHIIQAMSSMKKVFRKKQVQLGGF